MRALMANAFELNREASGAPKSNGTRMAVQSGSQYKYGIWVAHSNDTTSTKSTGRMPQIKQNSLTDNRNATTTTKTVKTNKILETEFLTADKCELCSVGQFFIARTRSLLFAFVYAYLSAL